MGLMCKLNSNIRRKQAIYNIQVRQYKKELDDSKKKLNKIEEQYAFAKNKEMLMGAQIDVLMILCIVIEIINKQIKTNKTGINVIRYKL